MLTRTLETIEQQLTQGTHLGQQVYISRRGDVLLDDGFGDATPAKPMRCDQWTAWLSAGKPLTAAAVIQLWERGLLGLDDPVARYIPEFSAHGKDAITLRHCLTHTAGIRAAAGSWSRLSYDQIISQISAAKPEPSWVVGQTAGYHVASTWFILGEVIARVSGKPINLYLREELLLPLAMSNTWVGMPPEIWDKSEHDNLIAPMHETARAESGGPGAPPETRRVTWDNPAGFVMPRPGANARGPIRELGRFYEFLLSDRHSGAPDHRSDVLSRAARAAMTARHRVGTPDLTFKLKMDWGLGVICNSRHYDQPPHPYGFGPHASPRAFGHGGNQSCVGMADPEHGLVIASSWNAMPGEAAHDKRLNQFLDAVYTDLGLSKA